MSKHRLSFPFTALVLGLLACSLGGVGNNSPTATPTGDRVILFTAGGEPVEIELPPPDFVDVMLAQVEEGKISLEEAVLTNLKLVAGEAEVEEVYGDQKVRLDSIWGLSMMALEVYESTSDEELKAELERLINKIAPPQENLDYYAAPANGGASQLPGLAAAMPLPPAQPGLACRSIWDEGFPTDAEDPPVVCLLYESFTAGGHDYRVYYPEERRLDPVFLEYVAAAVESLRRSQEELNPLSNIRDINLIFTTLASSLGSDVAASVPGLDRASHGGAPCPISVFPHALSVDIDDFKQALAHEVFHCLSFWRRGSTGVEAAAWYQEGMANHFSNVVYPSVNLEQREFLPHFDADSVDTWLMDMDYGNFVFFQYLENRFDNDYIMRLFDALPSGGSRAGQAAALAAFDDMQTVFHEFGQAYLTHQIIDTGGGSLPNVVYYLEANIFQIDETPDLSLAASVFTLERYALRFEGGNTYRINKETGGIDGENSWRQEGEAVFSEIPGTLSTFCGNPPTYNLLLTSANSEGETRLDLSFNADEEAVGDCCLVGTWEQGTSEIRSNLQSTLGSGITLRDLTGRFVVMITEGGSMSFTPQDYSVTLEDPDGEPFTASVAGASTSTYTIPEEGTIEATQGEVNFAVTMFTSEGPVAVPLPAERLIGGPFSSGGAFPYQCSEETLTVFTGDAAPFSSSTFTRVSEVPTTPVPDELPPPPDGGDTDPPEFGLPSSDCSQIALSDFTTSGDSASWTLSNNSGEDIEISAISLSKPGENGSLEEVTLAGESIWMGSESFFAILIESGWLGSPELRTLDSLGEGDLRFSFSSEAVAPSDYILAVNFANGCIVSDVR